jgi:hypothetical protein
MIIFPEVVMAGLDPWAFSPGTSSVAIHAPEIAGFDSAESVDHRVKPGDDDFD